MTLTIVVLLDLFIWSLISHYCMSHLIDCSQIACQRKFINCLPREDCLVSCNDTQSCVGSIINCPINGDCIVECRGVQSCQDVTIDATLSSGHVDVLCDDKQIEECRGIKIYGSTINTNTDNLNVSCIGNFRSCIDSEINCPFNGNCSISCTGDSSCKYSRITGPIHGDLDIKCNGDTSCFASILNGAESSKLSITGCKEHQSCLDLSIYCPPHTNGLKNCFIQGNDNLGRDKPTMPPTPSPSFAPTIPTINPTVSSNAPTISPTIAPTVSPTNIPSKSPTPYQGDGLVIYAVNGWKDVDIDYSGSFGIKHEGKMVCGYDYGVSCNIASNDWSCRNINEYCNDVEKQYFIPSYPNTPSPIISSTQQSITPTLKTTVSMETSTIYKKPNIVPTTGIIMHETEIIDIDIIMIPTNDSIVAPRYNYRQRRSGEIMIIIGSLAVMVTCIVVALASAKKQKSGQYEAKPSMSSCVTITAENPDTDDDQSTDSETSDHLHSSDLYDPNP